MHKYIVINKIVQRSEVKSTTDNNVIMHWKQTSV